MIRLQDMTPDVYYNQSRDFQFIGRLFDIVLNAVKTNTDLINECPISDNLDTSLIDLVALTLGFKSKHNYNVRQLKALCTTFLKILKKKGSIESIELALTTLFQAENVDQKFSYDLSEDHTLLTVFIPATLSDINLFKDLLNYILPAGMSTRLVRTYLKERTTTTYLTTQDKVVIKTQGNDGIIFREPLNNIPYPDGQPYTTEHGDAYTIYRDSSYTNAYLYQNHVDTDHEEDKVDPTAPSEPTNENNQGDN